MRSEARVLLVQTVLREAMNGRLFEVAVEENLFRTIALVEKSVRRNGAPNIVVLPEFFLTGLSSTRSHEQCLEMARLVPGPETAELGKLAAEYGVYLAGATWERDDSWPGRWWNTAFIVGPSGEVELKYRKINEGNYQLGLTDTTPGDVYDEYVARYGEDALWPVLDTDYGRLACIICFDLNFAETTRMLALRGAEVILNPTGEPYGEHRDAWEFARRTRAFENLAYFVSTNHGGYVPTIRGERFVDGPPGLFTRREAGGITPTARSHGGSEVVDFTGRVIARIDGQGEATIEAVLDLAALRQARERWPRELATAQAITGPLAASFADGYRDAPGFPLNELAERPLRERADGPRHLSEVIDTLRSTPIMHAGDGEREIVALAFQAGIDFAAPGAGDDEVHAAARRRIDETVELLDSELARTGAGLVLLPDGWPLSFLAGARASRAGGGATPRPGGDGRTAGHGPGLDLDGPEMAAIADFASSRGVLVGGAFLERDPAGGGPFRTAWLVDEHGALVLTHRSLLAGPAGYEPAALPAPADPPGGHAGGDTGRRARAVAHTSAGTVALVVGREVLSVELLRLYAADGAELVLNPVAEHDARLSLGLYQARRTRASENCCYLVVAGQGPLGHPAPGGASRTGSMVVDFDGEEVVSLEAGRCAGVAATLDLGAARRRRASGRMNKLVQLRPQLYAPGYARLAAGAGRSGPTSRGPGIAAGEPAPTADGRGLSAHGGAATAVGAGVPARAALADAATGSPGNLT